MADGMIQKKTLTEQVADAIRRRILAGTYRAGEQLPQERIAAEMGVSRIPVREALHQLHSEGFVTLVSHKGAVVSEVSLEEILELYELRARIETWLLGLAIPSMTDADYALIQKATDQFGAAVQQVERSYDTNWDVHHALYRPSGRRATIEIDARLHQQIERYTRMMVSLTDADVDSHREHQELLELCRKRRVAPAVKLLDFHIKSGSRRLVDRLRDLRDGRPAPGAPPLPRVSARPRTRS